jgi:hypothetical protein
LSIVLSVSKDEPVMNRFDFSDFINSIINKNYHEMIQAAENEAYRVEKISYGVKGCVENRRAGSTRYVDELKKFLFFMRQGMIPSGSEQHVWQYKRVAEKLVEKGQFKPSVLDLFGK